MSQVDNGGDQGLSDEVEHPDKNTNHNDTGNDNQGVLSHLLGGRPDNLLQLTSQLAEVSGDGTPGSLEPVFLFNFSHCPFSLLGLVVNCVLLAESAVLSHFETVRVILLVFHRIVVSLLALRTSQSDFNAHNGTSLNLPPCITPAIKNLESGQLHFRPEAEKGHNFKPVFSQVEPFYHSI